ncbi:hypothetical protein, partial [Peribacillus sp.]|uniref:hypothetical protein n=1 Tax=Peribacillus sp. TaxID=2675267 RepID=UPI00388E86A0
ADTGEEYFRRSPYRSHSSLIWRIDFGYQFMGELERGVEGLVHWYGVCCIHWHGLYRFQAEN